MVVAEYNIFKETVTAGQWGGGWRTPEQGPAVKLVPSMRVSTSKEQGDVGLNEVRIANPSHGPTENNVVAVISGKEIKRIFDSLPDSFSISDLVQILENLPER